MVREHVCNLVKRRVMFFFHLLTLYNHLKNNEETIKDDFKNLYIFEKTYYILK